MNELEDNVDADEELLLPAEEVLMDLMAEGKDFAEAAIEAFPLKKDPVRFASFRLKKRDLYRSFVIAHSDKKFSDFKIIDKYTEILTDPDEANVVQLKALKDYHEFRESFTKEAKTVAIHDVDAAGVVNHQTVNNFFANPSPSATMNSVLIPKEQIYAKRNGIPDHTHEQNSRQLDISECQGDVRNTSETNKE